MAVLLGAISTKKKSITTNGFYAILMPKDRQKLNDLYQDYVRYFESNELFNDERVNWRKYYSLRKSVKAASIRKKYYDVIKKLLVKNGYEPSLKNLKQTFNIDARYNGFKEYWDI